MARATKEEKGSADAGAAKGGKFTADGADVESMDDDKPLLICAFDVVGATPEQEAQIREVRLPDTRARGWVLVRGGSSRPQKRLGAVPRLKGPQH